uniref:General transcription and DNA repair factor IIH subunit TFB5 n=1 Tax=Gallus gallus TaxID=9031 RepID=A0A8V0XMM4_CHICK
MWPRGRRWPRLHLLLSVTPTRTLSCHPHLSAFVRAARMVNVLKGVLIECDPAMKQFLLYLDESNALGKKFIIQDLDETHVFVLAELVNFLQERVGELMDQNSFPITQK